MDARSVAWIAAAIGLLVAGMVGAGAIREPRWTWVPPVVGFAAYVLAFRRGLRRTRAKGDRMDDVWRVPSSARRESSADREIRWNWTLRDGGDRRQTVRPGSADRRWPAAVTSSRREA